MEIMLIRVLCFIVSSQFSASLLKRFNGRSKTTLKSVTSVADLRKEYSKKGINEQDFNNPLDLFKVWFNEACESKILEPNAMCLATCSNNIPSARFVLLKDYDANGFVWYTNYNSRKGMEIKNNPNAALTFWWGELERSVRIEGVVEIVSKEESTKYFLSRPRSSQIGAWTSNQSQIIMNRSELEANEREIINRFEDASYIPKPDHWGGFRLIPNRIEFWKGRESRLHDRIVFTHGSDTEWKIQRLQP